MPKFYRQNKKRIDPRYFLNETTNRDLSEGTERIGIDDAFENLRSDLLDMTETYLEPNQGEIVDTLLKQLDKFKCGRVQVDQSVPSLSPSNIQQLAALSDSDPSRFFEIAAMLTKTGTGGTAADNDGDGISNEKEAALKKVLDSP